MRTSPLHLGRDLRREVKRGEFFYSLTTAPTVEPVTLDEAKLFARIDDATDDALVTALIITARQNVENQTGRSLLTQAWTATLDLMPQAGIFELINRPILSITSIRAYNDDDTYEEIDVVNDIILDGQNGRVSLKSSAASISGDRATSVFEIVYATGYGSDASDVPEWAKLAIKQMVAHWYENREAITDKQTYQVPFGAQLLIDQNCVVEL
jgi:uncharacterized phiE125 gp8 family phage protein